MVGRLNKIGAHFSYLYTSNPASRGVKPAELMGWQRHACRLALKRIGARREVIHKKSQIKAIKVGHSKAMRIHFQAISLPIMRSLLCQSYCLEKQVHFITLGRPLFELLIY